MLDRRLISVRNLSEEDIPMVLDYWLRSPPGYVENLGIDPKKMPSEEQMEANLRLKIQLGRSNGKSNALAILYEDQAVGMHTLNPLIEGDHGIFHAHICRPEYRRKGVGEVSYPLACEVFMWRFNLKYIKFMTPIQNRGAIQVKEKLRIPCIGEETIGFGLIKPGTRALVYELTPELLSKIRGQV